MKHPGEVGLCAITCSKPLLDTNMGFGGRKMYYMVASVILKCFCPFNDQIALHQQI